MKPRGKEYAEPVIIPRIWELIGISHHLVTEEVSEYIRQLEDDVATLTKFKQSVLDHVDNKIEFLSSGEEMKSLNESIQDGLLANELIEIKSLINK